MERGSPMEFFPLPALDEHTRKASQFLEPPSPLFPLSTQVDKKMDGRKPGMGPIQSSCLCMLGNTNPMLHNPKYDVTNYFFFIVEHIPDYRKSALRCPTMPYHALRCRNASSETKYTIVIVILVWKEVLSSALKLVIMYIHVIQTLLCKLPTGQPHPPNTA